MEATARALAAVAAVGRAHGLPVDDLRTVRESTNVLVHLAPAPVVARVPFTLARLRGIGWYRTEIELASFLLAAGAPVAGPSAEVDPGPHEHDGLHVSFWRWIDHDPDRQDPAEAGRSLRSLHEAFVGYARPLPTYDRLDEVAALLPLIAPSELVSPDELASLEELHTRLASLPRPEGRPIHGDAHLGNILWSPEGPLWTDLENACSGPVEYDLACIHWRGGAEWPHAAAGYGAHNCELVSQLEPYLALFLAPWTVLIADRVGLDGARDEARRRVERAVAYAREM